jgi:hypothetical protein
MGVKYMVCMHGWMYGCEAFGTYVCMGGWMDGWMDVGMCVGDLNITDEPSHAS